MEDRQLPEEDLSTDEDYEEAGTEDPVDDEAIRFGNNRKHQSKAVAKAKRKAQKLARRKNRAPKK